MKSVLVVAFLGAILAAVYSSHLPSVELEPTPTDINLNNIFFDLNVRENMVVPCEIDISKPKTLDDCLFNSSHKTIIQVPGFLQKCTGEHEQGLMKAYLTAAEYNVFCVDYSGIVPSADPLVNAVNVGDVVRQLIAFLIAQGKVKPEELHLVGHSLGGQICGFSGYPVYRITALDPAGKEFNSAEPWQRLNTSSATYVDVIHTNAGNMGINQSIGHADFYPNGGMAQPDCGLDVLGGCSHFKGYAYLVQSLINGSSFPVLECESDEEAMSGSCTGQTEAVMGEDAINRSPPGIYWLYIEPESREP